MTSKSVAYMVLATAVVMISSLDIYTPAMPLISDVFEVSDYTMKLTFLVAPFTTFLFSIPIGHSSDIHGRRPVMLLCLSFFVLGGFICMISPNIQCFFVGRILLSLGAGGLNVLCGSILADMFRGVTLAKYMAIYGSLFPVVFACAPIIGAQLLTHFGWRSIFFTLTVTMGLFAVMLARFLPETHNPEKHHHTQDSTTLFRRLKNILKKPDLFTLALTHAMPMCIGGIFTVNAPFLFIDKFHFDPIAFSFIQSIPIILHFLGSLCYRYTVPLIQLDGALKVGFMTTSIFILTVGGTLIGWIPQAPFLIVGTICLFSIGSPFIISTATALLIEAAPHQKGLIMSVMALIRSACLSIILTLASSFTNSSIFPLFTSMFIVALLVLLLIGQVVKFYHKHHKTLGLH
jgi:MFS transporter, DHA1 family, multidrug resistance protein